MVDKPIENVLCFKFLKVFYLMVYLSLNVEFWTLSVYDIKNFASFFYSLSEENFLSTKLDLIGLRILNDFNFMHLLLFVQSHNLCKLEHFIDALNLVPVDVLPQKVSRVML